MISIRSAKTGLTAGVLLLSAFALTGCMVPKNDLDDAQAQNAQLTTQNQQLQTQVQTLTTQVADDHTQICRLMGAIKYTVNSDLLFPSGSYEMSSAGQQIIGRLASQLAQFQQHHLVVDGYTDNQPVGSMLRRKGIDSNEALSQKRAENVMAYLVSQGVQPGHGVGEGLWRHQSRRLQRHRGGSRDEPARRAPPRRYGLPDLCNRVG